MYTEEVVSRLKQKIAVADAKAAAAERHAERCLELVAKMAKENGAVSHNALDLARRATEAEAHAADVDHELLKVAAERDGFRARAETAERAHQAAVAAEHTPEAQRLRELLHNLPVDPIVHRTLEDRHTDVREVDGDTLDAVFTWLAEVRKVALL